MQVDVSAADDDDYA